MIPLERGWSSPSTARRLLEGQRLMTPTACMSRGGRPSLAERSPPHQPERDHGECLASIRLVAWTGASGVAHLHPGRGLGRADRDRGRRGRRQSGRPANHRLGQFPRRLRRDPSDLPRRHGNRSAHRSEALLVEHDDRRRRLRRALPRRAGLCAFRHRLAVAAGADRRNRALHHFSRRRLCGDDRDRLQQHRDRQDHSCRLLHQ